MVRFEEQNMASGAQVNAANVLQPEQKPSNVVEVPNLDMLLSGVCTTSPLSSEGRDYFEYLKKEISRPESMAILPINIRVLNNPQDTLALELHGKYILLIPSESIRRTQEEFPNNLAFAEAKANYDAITGHHNHELLEVIEVAKIDYPLVKKMLAYVRNIFHVIHNQSYANFNITSMNNTKFSVSVNHRDVDIFVEDIYPHAPKPRNDFGFVLYRNKLNTNKEYFPNANAMTIQEPIAAVTGYVEVVLNTNAVAGSAQFIPIVHISHMYSVIPDIRMTHLLIPLASDIFIRFGLWKTQFYFYSKDRANIGSLFRDTTNNMPMFCENQNKVDELLRSYFAPPALCLDHIDGVARIPGTHRYTRDSDAFEISNSFYKFSNADANTPRSAEPFTTIKYSEYVGTVNFNSKIADSRWCDYLNTMVHFSSDMGSVMGMLDRNIDPKVRAEQIRKFYPSFEIQSTNEVAAVNLRNIVPIQEMIRKNIYLVNSNFGGNMSTLDMSTFLDQGQYFSANPGQAGFTQNTGMGGGSFFPSNILYRN